MVLEDLLQLVLGYLLLGRFLLQKVLALTLKVAQHVLMIYDDIVLSRDCVWVFG